MKLGHPKALYLLFAVEMWERFSYYGMRALLTLYMVKFLLFNTEQAGNVYGTYTGLVYATPLIGGYLADRYLGAKNCIIIGGFLMALGQFLLSVPSIPFFYIALGLLIIGNGFFKPNISSIVGQLYEKNDHRRDGGFTIFYMGINLGAFMAPLICGYLGERIGFKYGFMAAGFGMLIGMTIFLVGKKYLLKHYGLPPAHCNKLPICEKNVADLDAPLTKIEKQRIAVIFALVFFSVFFWASFEQAGSSLTLFAEHSTNRIIPFLNWEMPTSFFQSVNPLFIFILAPMFSSMWLKLSDFNKDPSAPAKFVYGLGFVAISFLVMVLAASLAHISGDKVSFLWLIGVYFLQTVGELCISPVGLSMVTKLSPLKFTSLLMGTWFLGSFLANYTGGHFAGNYDSMDHRVFFMMPVLLTGGAAISLLFLVKPLKRWMHGIE